MKVLLVVIIVFILSGCIQENRVLITVKKNGKIYFEKQYNENSLWLENDNSNIEITYYDKGFKGKDIINKGLDTCLWEVETIRIREDK